MENKEIETKPCEPPFSLVKWAKKQNLLTVFEYENEYELVNKIYTSLLSIQNNIDHHGAINAFWNVQYSGKKIITRTPKKETDVHPTIRSFLETPMLLASIEIITEYQTGVGNLDFMFIGNVKNKGQIKICAEFKNAHSDDLINGLTKQLPAYMHNTESDYGAYCILNYKGEWFDKPDFSDKELQIKLAICQSSSSNPLVNKGIRVIPFNLSKKTSASNLR